MATKKHIPAKSGKPAPKKLAKPVKKAAPVKKAIAVKKTAAPAHKKAAKPISKKTITGSRPAIKKTSKPKTTPKKAPKPIVKLALKKPLAVKPTPVKSKKPVITPIAKKVEIKNPPAKPAPVRIAEPVKAKDIKIIPAKPVVLPKINTKTSRKYQPDFTKSVLDQPPHDLGAPIVRYSDSDLAEFRELIQRKLESAKKELSYLQGLITRKDEMGGDNDDARYMTMEDGSMSMEREQLSQMASRQITFIDHLEKALMRIENKTYGICRVTGRLIDKARLRAVPHATLSIEAKMGAVK